jgi:3-oxoadipate enol-lactonase
MKLLGFSDSPAITADTLEHDGCSLHYWLAGPESRPLVVLTHGAFLDHRAWDAQWSALTREYRVLTWDLRGHGLSRPRVGEFSVVQAADDLLVILDALEYPQAVFVGHGMGGNVTQELVFRHPERASALVMLDCSCNTLRTPPLENLLLWLAPLLVGPYPYELLKHAIAHRSTVTHAVEQELYAAFSRLSKEEILSILTGAARCLHYEPGYFIAQPLLLAYGEYDDLGSMRRIVHHWAAREPNCRYRVIPQAGHVAHLDQPDFTTHLLLDFLHGLG